MINRHFGDFVDRFTEYDGRLAMTIRPFLRIERVNYLELQTQTYQIANYLRARDVRLGDRIMVVANNSPSWVQLFLGAQLIGAVLVPVDASSTPATTQKLIDQTDPKLLFRSRHLHAELESTGG